MTLKQYYKAVDVLEAPTKLTDLAKIKAEIEKLKEKLSAEDLKELAKRQKRWQDKVDSSIL